MMPVMARRAPTPVSLHDPIFLKFRWLVLYSVFAAGSVAFGHVGRAGRRRVSRLRTP